MWKTLRKEAPAAAERVGRDSGRLYRKVKEMVHRLYQTITEIDFTDKSSRAILRIVLVNFIILAVTSIFWFYGIMALIIYSVILYFILKKYFNEIKKNYHRLLEATNEIAMEIWMWRLMKIWGCSSRLKKRLRRYRPDSRKR